MLTSLLHMLFLLDSASAGVDLLHLVCLLVYSLPMNVRQLEHLAGSAAV